MTPITLWISLGSGLIAGGALAWLVLFKSKQESLKPKQWAAIIVWGPLSALFVGWSMNWMVRHRSWRDQSNPGNSPIPPTRR